MEITHIHDHPLMFKEEVEKNIYRASLFCNVCDEAVVGPYYSCNQCPRSSSFIVHKSCTELPVQMHHHPLHAEHPLTLIRNARNYTCNVCREKFYGPTLATFAYCCSKSGCDFILDLKCASTWHKVTENHFGDHPHQFSRYKKPKLKFECEACGEEGRYSVYICSICKLWVHKNCTSLPGHLKTRAHPHLLMLKWSLEGIIKIRQEVCNLCYENMYGSGCFYYCEPCHYIAHNRCAVMVGIDDLDDDEMIEEASNADHPINPDVQHSRSPMKIYINR